tara:strand:+ start:2103 stop:2345 length:243 start_codon:yes stop_codon:yes gene_type:complete
MVDTNKLIEVLKQGIVEIKFKSLRSGNIYQREYTTHDSYMPISFKQSASDKIICYDVEFKKMEDIDIDSIEQYTPLEKLS